MQRLIFELGLVLAGAIGGAGVACASAAHERVVVVVVTLKDHRFSPDVITVPAGQKVRIDITNRDGSADDFDSDALHVDRDLKPHERAVFEIGPLKPGHYPFKGELHAATAHGEVVAVAH